MLLWTAVKSEGCILSYTSYPPLDGPLPLTPNSRGHQQNLFAICKKKKKQGRGDQKEGLQKTVKLCSMSPLIHAVFNLLCASWRLRECVRARERIMLRNDREAATSELSLEIQDIDFT